MVSCHILANPELESGTRKSASKSGGQMDAAQLVRRTAQHSPSRIADDSASLFLYPSGLKERIYVQFEVALALPRRRSLLAIS